MRNFNDCSKKTLLDSCRDYLTTAKDVNRAKSNLKKSFTLLIVFLFTCSFILNSHLFFDLFDATELHRLTGFIFLLLFSVVLLCFRSWILKKKLKADQKQQLYLDYRIHLIEKNKIWFDIKGQMKALNIEQINDNFIKYLLTPLIVQ
ncbi:hypothetical protein [Psychromonas aquimarina]|uniref:hypothetical protein n=1 Tax=Psychromonas aquimarina TaxID=444919 RepID=UPI0003FFB0A2|nr:hypothetical protein [Psychromonas aquimarina]